MTVLSVLVVLLSVVVGPVSAGSQPAPPAVVESTGSIASIEVQPMLAEVDRMVEIGRLDEALAASDRALALARRVTDAPGAALAHRSRAGILQRMKRNDEAVGAWREAMAIWAERADSPGRIEGLASMGVLLLAQDAGSSEGRRLLEQAFELADEERAPNPLRTARALHDAGNTARRSSRIEEATRLFSTAVAILEHEAPGSEALAESLIGLGRSGIGWGGDSAPARAALDRALYIARRVAPGGAVEAECLYWMGELEATVNQDFAAARGFYQRALALQDAVDPDGYRTSSTLEALGICEVNLGSVDQARQRVSRALSIRESVSAPPPTLAWLLNSLGAIELFSGHFDEAKAYFERVAEIWRQPGDEVRLAQALVNLAVVATEQWRFEKGRSRFEEALALLDQHAPTHDARGKILGGLREMCTRQGDYEAAESYSKMELAFFEQHYPDSRQLSFALTGAGNLALQRDDPRAARTYHERALAIRRRTSPGSELVSESLMFIAEACVAAGDLDEAVVRLQRGLENEGKDAATGQDAAQIVSLLGRVAYLRGEFQQAERHQRRAVKLWEDFAGPGGMSSLDARLQLAEGLQGLGRTGEAFDVALQCESMRRTYLRISSRTLTEREALAYGAARGGALDLTLTLAADAGRRIPEGNRRAFDAVIRSRAAVLDEVAARNRSLYTGSDPEAVVLAKEYAAARDRVARLVIRGPAGADLARYQNEFAASRTAVDRTERALLARSGELRRELARERAGLDEVARGVPPSGALVAFVRYHRVDPDQSHRRSELSWDEGAAEYAAFVLRGGSTEPVLVPLGPAGEIDELVSELRRQVSAVVAAGPVGGRRTADQYRSVGASLRGRVWDPVAAMIGDSNRVLVVPDGPLSLVDLAALPVGGSQYLVETGPRIHYLSAERDVLGYGGAPASGRLLALGDPAFDEPSLFAALAPAGVPVAMDEAHRLASATVFRGTRSSCSGFRSMHFKPLPATGDEVDEVVGLWLKEGDGHGAEPAKRGEVISLRGASASEAALKALAPGARIIHLATHGFFLGGGCPSATDGATRAATGGVAPAATGENPLLLSGFALAGANHREAAGPDEEDGILTAEEIAAIDLSGVRWAVLSGCGTGLGEIRAGEGVLGLRRAFQVAGARTVIMSLWPVEDETTRTWMKALYDNRFAKGMSTVDAVHEANLQLLRQRREAGLSTHPATWAGFIASGDWH